MPLYSGRESERESETERRRQRNPPQEEETGGGRERDEERERPKVNGSKREKEREAFIPEGQTTQISTSHTFSLRVYDLHGEKTGADDLMFFAGGGEHMPLPAPVR